jgi:lipid-binding SYLF domain-containing protein
MLTSKEPMSDIPCVERSSKSSNAFEVCKVSACAEVLREIVKIPEQLIPPALLKNAHGIAIFRHY